MRPETSTILIFSPFLNSLAAEMASSLEAHLMIVLSAKPALMRPQQRRCSGDVNSSARLGGKFCHASEMQAKKWACVACERGSLASRWYRWPTTNSLSHCLSKRGSRSKESPVQMNSMLFMVPPFLRAPDEQSKRDEACRQSRQTAEQEPAKAVHAAFRPYFAVSSETLRSTSTRKVLTSRSRSAMM